jgi:hypothetical protein
VFNSVEDGNHLITPVNDQYQKSDFHYQFSVDPDVNAGNTILRLHFVYSKGTSDVYSTGAVKGYDEGMGIQIGWLH